MRARFLLWLSLTALAALLGAGLWANQADASGISVARFGGEHGHPTGTNPSTIYYNPGAIGGKERPGCEGSDGQAG